jgi:hypothetical protein
LIVAVFGIACGVCSKAAAQVSSADDASLAQEASRLSDELGKQGFLVPYVVTLDGSKRFELFVAPQDTEHVISLLVRDRARNSRHRAARSQGTAAGIVAGNPRQVAA